MMQKLKIANILAVAAFVSGMLTLVAGPIPLAHAQLSVGDILVLDVATTGTFSGALFNVDPFTGNRTQITDFGNSSQGPQGLNPFGVAVDALGTILVVDLDLEITGTSSEGALFTVDPSNGSRTILSDFGNAAQGPLGREPNSIAIDASGTILVTDSFFLAPLLFAIDPSNGSRTILSDFSNAAQGPTGLVPTGIAIGPSGTILVLDRLAGTGFASGLFAIDPSNGDRTLLSDFGDASQGPTTPPFLGPSAMATDASGTIAVVDPFGQVFTVDPSNGDRTLLTDLALPSFATGIAIGASGTILVSVTDDDESVAGGLLIGVNPSTGIATTLSDFGDSTQGPVGINLRDVTVVLDLVTPPPLEQLANLVGDIGDLGLAAGITNSLQAQIAGVVNLLNDACSKLDDFIGKVNKQEGKKLTSEQADDLRTSAVVIKGDIGCSDADGDGFTVLEQDCNDIDPSINPDAPEVCDSIDNNCDTQVDEGFSGLGQVCLVGIGTCQRSGTNVCTANGAGVVCNATPGAPSPEVCDGLDNDCDGQVDEGGGALCNDAIGCTVDTCGGPGGCTNTPDDTVCDDFNPCTSDFCSPGTDCSNVPVPDGTACGVGLSCQGGECLP